MTELVVVYVGFGVLALFFRAIQARYGANVPPISWRERRTDWLYWLVSPLLTGTVTRLVTLGLVALAARAAGLSLERARHVLAHGHGPLGASPLFAQCLAAIALGDLVGYWSHRARHAVRFLWRAHAVHHSARALDWLAAARMHPLDDALDNTLISLALLGAGLPLPVVAGLEVFFLLHTMLLHAAVPWRFGPLRYVFVSPALHRWHHAEAARGNYAGVFAVYDLLFRTMHLPPEEASVFGAAGEAVPESLFAQLAYPLRAWSVDLARALDGAPAESAAQCATQTAGPPGANSSEPARPQPEPGAHSGAQY